MLARPSRIQRRIRRVRELADAVAIRRELEQTESQRTWVYDAAA